MKNIIIGTAGHVDHGKTQLIKALSGMDTDRLSEEKKRGITIELGFAHIPNDEGYNIGVIDVPGHEKFIKNMLAGIGGIDFVLFVVAADEGIMPQTREHFEILQALGIDDGIIVVTKTDMVEDDWMELLLEEVQEYVRGSFLEDKPLVAVSSKTGDNIDLLKKEILAKCDREAKRNEDPRMFRLPVDRVFSMAGFGTVVTGTLLDGTLAVNEEKIIYPSGIKTKIRGIQTYGSEVSSAVAGQRTAVNLSGIKKEEMARGDVLASANAVNVTSMIDVALTMFKSSERQVLNNSRVHLYLGSKEVLCKVVLLDRDVLAAGETAFAQLRLEEPVALRRGDRFIVRFYSPILTIGGGRVLDAVPEKHKRNREAVLEQLGVLADGDLADVVKIKTGQSRYYRAEELAYELGVVPEQMERVLNEEAEKGTVLVLEDGFLLSATRMERLTERLTRMLGDYHAENPLAEGMPKQELLSRLREAWFLENTKILSAIVTYHLKGGIISDKGKSIALCGFTVEFSAEQRELKAKIADLYTSAGLEMLRNEEVYELDGDRRVVAAILAELAEEGVIVKVDPSYFVVASGWNEAVRAAEEIGREKGRFTLAEYRDKLDTSRKYASVLLQSLDRAGVTIFNGESRSVQR